MHIHLDLIGGVAGDMLLGALTAAGASLEALQASVTELGLGARLEVSTTHRRGLLAHRVQVSGPESPPHRAWRDVRALLGGLPLPERARARALAAFAALAEAEAAVHGAEVEEVHFHEVGAIDAIVDVVGTCLALELLGVDTVSASAFPLGQGSVAAAHGRLPVPVPAVLELLARRGAPSVPGQAARELVTPTGAALVTTLAGTFGAQPAGTVRAVGYGAGAREAAPGEPANLTRAVLLEPAAATPEDEVVVLEANLDDQEPEQVAHAAEALLAAGALDAFLTPVLMKKGRPGAVLSALCAPADAERLTELLLRETTSLGVRSRRERRRILPRWQREVPTRFGPVQVKFALRPGGELSAAPEFESCKRVAAEAGVPLRRVHLAALQAAAGVDPRG
ncbi:MAG: nickel pincer cofactor biosynthesis protein LarC [Planctomycetes bacterium]|nr:nickel pincer cofactor biosynthesis protein LarC [Planctomycetota bacterium]